MDVDKKVVIPILAIAILSAIAVFVHYYAFPPQPASYAETLDPNVKLFVKKSGLPRIKVSTDAISNGFIKKEFTCYGNSEMPKITWTKYDDAPCYAVIVFDPDVKTGVFIHLFEIVNGEGKVVKVFYNSALRKGWFPVCPPRGEVHRYYFLVVALDKCEVEGNNVTQFLSKHALAIGYAIGRFGVK